VDSGAVHSVEITAANEADINVLPKLLRVEDEVIFGDAMRATTAMNTNGALGSWEYAGCARQTQARTESPGEPEET